MHGRSESRSDANVYRRETGSVSNKSELTFTSLLAVDEKPLLNVSSHESFPQTDGNSHLIHTVELPNTKGFNEAGANAKFNASNNTSSFGNFHLIKRRSDVAGVQSGTNLSRSGADRVSYKGPVKIIKSENKVNTTRVINVFDTTKFVSRLNGSENVVGKASGNGTQSMDYNRLSQQMLSTEKPRAKSAKKKSKNRVKSGRNSTVKSLSNKRAKKLSKVSLLGLFEMTTHLGKTRWEGQSELAAAKLAVKHINERRLINGYVLDLITNDTQVRTRLLFEQMNRDYKPRLDTLHEILNLINKQGVRQAVAATKNLELRRN